MDTQEGNGIIPRIPIEKIPADHKHIWDGGSMRLDEFGNTTMTFTCMTCGTKTTRLIQNLEISHSQPLVTAEPDGHYHCWHHTGRATLMAPPSHIYMCCHCGEVRHFREGEFVSFSLSPHGSHTKH